MHNLDRTQLETEQESYGLGHEYEHGENEQFLGDILGAITGGELELPLHESQELELASELLEVSSEQELEQFLGNVFKSVGRAAGQFVRSDTGRALGGILKDAARQALPVVGRAIGGDTGAGLASQAGSLLGLELEGLSPPDQEFEAARQFVRFAGAAAKHAAAAPRNVSPQTAARAAVVAAAHHHAPGLAHGAPGHAARAPHPGARTGGPAHAHAHARPQSHAGAARPHPAGPRPQPHHRHPQQPHHRHPQHPQHPHHRHPHHHHHHHPRYTGPAFVRPPQVQPQPYAPQPAGPQQRPRNYFWYDGAPWYRAAPAPPPAPAPVPAPPAPAYRPAPTPSSAPAQRSEWGRWQRRGSVIVIYGA